MASSTDPIDRVTDFKKTAAVKSLRQMYPVQEGMPRTLSDGQLSGVMIAAGVGTPNVILLNDKTVNRSRLEQCMPKEIKEHYRNVRDKSWEFFSNGQAKFTHMCLFARSKDDGILIGFADNDLYYIVASWDITGNSIGAIVPKE